MTVSVVTPMIHPPPPKKTFNGVLFGDLWLVPKTYSVYLTVVL